MFRVRTELEKSESPKQQAHRLFAALNAITSVDDLAEAKRIALQAMRGELHGYEAPPVPGPRANP